MKKTIKDKILKVGRSVAAFTGVLAAASSCIALADGDGTAQITNALNNLGLLVQLVAAGIGAVLLVWNIIQLAIAWQSHDASQRTQSFIGIAAAVLIAVSGTIASYIMG